MNTTGTLVYKHTQPATVIIIALGVAEVGLLWAGLTTMRPLLFVAAILAVAAGLFYSLTIEVDATRLIWRFGPGVIHKQARLDEIVSAEVVRTNLLEGWGIHLSRFGWLYNASGFGAVAIQLRNGKRFALGTDEPEALLRALHSSALTRRSIK